MKKVSLLILVSLVLIVLASCQVLPKPVKDALGIHEHEWTDATCESPKTCECGATEGEALGHTWTEATCTAPKTCSVCQATEGEALGHDYTKANCTDPATCKNCGATTGKALGHSWLDATCTDPKTCEDCGAIEGEALGHTAAAAVRENEVAPGCETDGKYDSVIYCSACKAEISREKDVVDPATGHKAGTPVKQNEKAPTCTVAGSYDEVTYCTVEGCGAEVSRKTVTVEATGHKPGEAVHENGTEPDCINGGAYEEVYYCTVEGCGAEISREYKTVDALGHKMAPATCIALSTCTVCGYTEGEYADHTPAAEVKENEVAPKCEQNGSYDIVVYCSVEGCGHEISRKTVTVDATGHNMVEATCQAPKHCANNCGLEEGEKTNHKLEATYGANVSYACPMCNTTYTMTAGTLSDGTQHNAMSFGDNGVKGYGDDKAAIVDGHYELVLKETVDYLNSKDGGTAEQNAIGQHQIWVPASSGTGLAGLTSDNNAIGVLSFNMNIKGDNPDMPFRVQLVDYSSDAGRWTEEWCIADYVFKVAPITSAEQTTVDVYGWATKKIGTLTLTEDQWTGWVNVAMVIIPRGDDLTIHYYINNEYWESITLPLTTKTKGINSVYFTGSTVTKGTGFKYDNIAFGCVQNAEWTLDVHTHTWIDADCEHAKTCYICGVTEGDPLGHTEATKDENFVYPDCVNTGSHEHVTYCSVCNKELKRETVTDAALGHEEQIVPGTPATCLEGGMTDGKICTREGCKTPTLEAQKPIPATGHKDENADKICDVCSADLNCKHEGERTPVDAVPPTCTATGLTAGEKCAICGEFTVPQTEVAAAGHKPGEEQRENAVAPTCTADGKYDSVYYCTVCGEMTSETKDVVDPKLGHDEVAHAGQAATCTDKGWKDYVTCSRCNYNTYEEIAALGHTWSGEATCVSGQTCSVCGAAGSAPDANNHKYVKGTEGANITYTCSACEHKVVVETYYEFTGANANDFTLSKNGNISTKVEGGVYVITNDDDTQNNEGNGGNQYMAFLPKKAADPKMNGFTCSNDAYGVVSFRISTNATKDLSVSLCTPRDDAANWVGWGKSDIKILSIKQAADGKRAVMGGLDASKHFFDVTIGENNWSEWVDVQVFIDLDPNGDITLIYFVDGTYYGTWTRNMINPEGKPYISSLDTRCLYFDGWTNGKGTGFKLDDVTFGYTAHKHDMTTAVKNGVVTYTCDCGNTFTVSDEYHKWNGESDDSTAMDNKPNGTVTMEVVNGQYEVMFKPATTTAPTFDATNDKGYESQDGWCEYDKKGWAGGQIQLWAPYAYGNGQFGEFSCENNSVGMISFKMKTNMTRHADQDTSLTFSIGKTRSPESHWTGWDNSSINIFTVEDYLESGVVLKGGLDGTNLNFGTVGVADGWSEWFEVMIVIEMSDNGYIYVYYYINGAFCGSDSRDLNNPPAGKRTLDPKEIETLQISGWTYAANTGIVFDDFYFGHTINGHNTLDGKAHIIPADATCGADATCSCGWTGLLVEHDLTPATCNAPATCKACGQTYGNALPHSNITSTSADGKPVYSCADCNAKFVLESQYLYYDGSDTSVLNAHYVGGSSSFNGGVNKYVSQDGVFVGISDQTVDAAGNGQLQMWIPHTKDQTANGLTFTDFTLANASVGALSFRVNLKFSNKSDIYVMKLVDNAWGAAGCIDVNVFAFTPIMSGDTVTGYKLSGYGPNSDDTDTQQLATFNKGDDGWSGWIDVKVILAMNPTTGNLEAYYYINGKYVTKGEKKVTTTNQRISCVYFNANIFTAGDGFKIDDIAFGHTIGGHNIFDGKAHYYTKAAENCGEKSTCVCGWEGYTVAHTYATDCQTNCSVCNAVRTNTAPHANLIATYGETVTYTCPDCDYRYAVDGQQYYLDGTDYTGMNGSSHNKNNGYATTGEPSIENGYYELKATNNTGGQWEITLPSNGHAHGMLEGLEAEKNAIGFLSFKMDIWVPKDSSFLQFTDSQVRKIEGADFWSQGALDRALTVTAPKAEGDKTYVTITGWNGILLAKVEVSGAQPYTGWVDIAIIISFDGDNVSLTYYVGGAYKGTATKVNNIITKAIDTAYFSCKWEGSDTLDIMNTGIKLDDIVWGYTQNGMSKVEAPEAPFYKEVIAKEDVTNEILKAVATNKIKQWDQSSAHNNSNGTPVYVVADKNGEDVQALYFSKTTPWVGDEGEQFSEFRFNLDSSKKVVSFSFDYKIDGTVEKNERYTFYDPYAGESFTADAYIQAKTVGSHTPPNATSSEQYPELKGTDLILDGEWHTMTYTFETPEELQNILFNLYHFQGELLVANFVVNYYVPFYNEVIAAENVTSATLKTINASKFKQCDQCTTVNAQGGTPVYVTADKNGETVEALYVSRTYAWAGTEAEQFTEFRFDLDSSKKVVSFSFDYKINGTVEKNERYNFFDPYADESFYSDAYVQAKTVGTHINKNSGSSEDYPELKGTDLVLDGEWHTMSYTFKTPEELKNILLNLYHFQGEMLIANLVINYYVPLYNEVIAAENVTNAALTTILAGKIKQVDQVNADSTRSEADATAAGDWYSSTNGTAVYVTTNVNGKDTEGVYFSRSKDWFNTERTKEEYGFSSFRFALNAKVKSITFSYRIDGTLEDCTYLGFNDKKSLLNDGSFTLTGNAYLEIVSNEDADKGTYYVVDHGTTFETDGQWHTMTIDLGEGMKMTNFLFSLYHFKGEMVVADLNVVYA